MRTAVSGLAAAHGRTKKDLNPNRLLPHSDTSSTDSLSPSQPPSRVDSDDGASAQPPPFAPLSMDGLNNVTGGPTTRRAWNDLCKSGNNSHHESHSEEEDDGSPLQKADNQESLI